MTLGLDLRLGIDVGGTNTDAVVMDIDRKVLAKTKQPTTQDVTGGIRAAIESIVGEGGIDPRRLTHVMLGTTHATNAVLERRNLFRVAVLRVGAPSSLAVKPMFGWPDDLVAALGGHTTVVRGGFEYDGREIVPFDPIATREFFRSVAGKVEAVAISAVFSPISGEHEIEAGAIASDVLGDHVPISMSHEIGSLGLLPRENATILNAALTGAAREVAGALKEALAEQGIASTVLFTQNDGTLMALDYAVRFPILTIGSGPANSIRGAAFLTGLSDAIIADVGGTSTDFGMLVNGFPRESATAVDIGGVSTNFRMPDILAIALGGGTVVRESASKIVLGPDSVGYRLPEEALVFGGSTVTLSDAAVASGRAAMGTCPPPADQAHFLTRALTVSDSMIADGIDRIKIGRGDAPLIVVGGGSVLISDSIPGVSKVLRPEHYDVANAIGAAIAQVSGRWEEVVSLASGRDEAIAAACEQARTRAILAGADPDHVEIVDIEEIPLAYLTEPVARLNVRAVGPLGRI